LIVLLWPQIAAVEDSAPAVARVKDFFESRDIQVVNMSDVLRDKNPYDMIVNRFDSHPGIPAQRLAAEQLYQAITSEPAP
jgi:dephospho-CoA kinase